jgi:hypothetical protein
MCQVTLRAICSRATGNAFPESDFSGTNTWANFEIQHGISLIVIVGCVKTLAVRAMFRPGFIDERVHIVAVYAEYHPVFRGCLYRIAHRYAPGAGVEGHHQTAKYQYITFHFLVLFWNEVRYFLPLHHWVHGDCACTPLIHENDL